MLWPGLLPEQKASVFSLSNPSKTLKLNFYLDSQETATIRTIIASQARDIRLGKEHHRHETYAQIKKKQHMQEIYTHITNITSYAWDIICSYYKTNITGQRHMRMGAKERLVANTVSCWSKRGETIRGQTDMVFAAKNKPIKIGLDLRTQSSTRGEWMSRRMTGSSPVRRKCTVKRERRRH
jgi:hypothetical protein